MKIGLVCPYNLFKGGGVQECVLATQVELSKRGHEVLIITPQPREYSGEVPEFVRLLGRSTDVKSPFHTTAQVSVSVDNNQVDDLLEREAFDVLHFHEPWVPLISYQILTRSKARNIATFHAKLPDTVMSRTIEKVVTPYTKSVLKYIHDMTAVSDAAASYVTSLTDRPVHIIPNGIDLSKYKPQTKTPAEEIIFYIGRLEKRKGLKFLLKAMKHLQQTSPNARLVIAGGGDDRTKLEQFARDNTIAVEFLGRVTEAEKLRLLKEARVFCSPARYGESFGIVLLEAMASGLPTVAGNNPGYTAVMRGTGDISIVDPRDTVEFARRLELMLHDENIRTVWKKWAADNIDQYDYPLIVDAYEKLYLRK